MRFQWNFLNSSEFRRNFEISNCYKRAYIIPRQLSIFCRYFVGRFRWISEDNNGYIFCREILCISSEYIDKVLLSGYRRINLTIFRRIFVFRFRRKIVSNVRRWIGPSECPSEFALFSCSIGSMSKNSTISRWIVVFRFRRYIVEK